MNSLMKKSVYDNVIVIIGLNPVERQRKEIIILKLYLYTKPIPM